MKTCSRCSAANTDDSRFCARCGARLVDDAPAGGNPGTLWLALNIAMTALSCLSNVLSIIGIVFGAIAVSRYNQGRYDEAQNNANVSKWLLISGLILALAGVGIAVAFGVLPAILAMLGVGAVAYQGF